MAKFTSPLDEVRVAAPCPADWEKMVGDGRVRYCDSCSLHVYNLSGMTRREAEGLVTSTEGRLCVRFYRRADGTILTRNCPAGLSAIRRRVSRAAGATLSAVLGFFAGLGLNLGIERAVSPTVVNETAVPAVEPFVIMGGMAAHEEQPEEVKGEAPVGFVEIRGRLAPRPDKPWRDAMVATDPERVHRRKG